MSNQITTRDHGILDYMSVGALLFVPRMLRWRGRVTNLLTGVAVGTMGYSLATRYEMGVFKVLPMRSHLLIDAISGIFLVMAPKIFKIRNPVYRISLIGFGLFEIAAASMTETADEIDLMDDDDGFLVPLDIESYVRE